MDIPPPPAASPTFEQARALREEALAHFWNGPERGAQDMRAHFLSLAGRGWTPYLHDYVGARDGHQGGPLFGQLPRHAPIFEELCRMFPATLDCWELMPRSAATAESIQTPWSSLGSAQRAHLVRSHGELLAPCGDPQAWSKAMAVALLPHGGSAPPDIPFHGYFESKAWDDLRAGSPALAWQLSAYLCCMASIPSAAPPGWAALACAQAEASRVDARPDLPGYPGLAASACVREHLLADRADGLSLCMRAIASDPASGEAAFFAKWKPEDGELRGFMERSSPLRSLITWRPGHPKTDPRDLFSPKACSARNPLPGTYAAELPLFTMAAVCGASACWDAIVAAHGPAPSLLATALHSVRLPSLPSIRSRLAAHSEAALSAGGGSLPALLSNMEREAARARRILSRLPLPADLLSALAGPGETIPKPPSAEEPSFDEDSRRAFARECRRALSKVLDGKPANVRLPVPYGWTSMALASGALPSFLSGRLPRGSLAKGAAPFEAYHPQGVALLLPAAECAWIERDELSACSSEPQEVAQTKRPRL